MRVIAFDIGGSTVRAGRVVVEGDVFTVEERRHALLSPADKTPEALLERIVGLVVELSGAPDAASVGDAVGLGIPGGMTPDGQIVANAPNLGWRNVPFGRMVAAQLPGTRVRCDNDLNAILLGEQRFGVARGCRHVVALYPGTGIGGAVMVDGRLVRGMGGFAGEIGHIDMNSGVRCGCGEIGCAETIAGGFYIEARVAEERARGGLPSRPEGLARLRVDDVDEAFGAGEPFAQALWGEVLEVLSGLGATACAFLNPEMVVLGGGVMTHAPRLRAALAEAIVQRAPVVCRAGLRVELGTLGVDAGLLGATALALE
jgi:glucokinase